jgi:hypothetical protein
MGKADRKHYWSGMVRKLGIWDLMFLAYHAHKRELAGDKPIKPMDIWMETVADVIVGDGHDPKVIQKEV